MKPMMKKEEITAVHVPEAKPVPMAKKKPISSMAELKAAVAKKLKKGKA